MPKRTKIKIQQDLFWVPGRMESKAMKKVLKEDKNTVPHITDTGVVLNYQQLDATKET